MKRRPGDTCNSRDSTHKNFAELLLILILVAPHLSHCTRILSAMPCVTYIDGCLGVAILVTATSRIVPHALS